MRIIFFTLSAVAILASCSSKQKPSFANNTEEQEWQNQGTIQAVVNAHSGRTVSAIDSASQYSLAFFRKIEDISTEPIKSVTYSYWVYIENLNFKAKAVLTINLGDKNIYWQGNVVQEKVKEAKKWIQVTETFNLPENIDKKASLFLFVLNDSKERILIDDIDITFN